MAKELEIIGRLQLWEGALRDCIQCIELCGRMHLTAESPQVEQQELARQQHLERIMGRIENPHVAYPEDQSVHDSFRRWLPTERECDQIIFHLHRLTVIYFLQLYTQGDSAPGLVLDNMAPEAKEIRVRLEHAAFPEQSEFDRYQQLKAALRTFRHEEIAHADGARFEVRHQANAVSYTSNGIDPDTARALQSMIPALREAIWKELNSRLSSQANGVGDHAPQP